MKKLPIFLLTFLLLLLALVGLYLGSSYFFDGGTSVVLRTYEVTKNEEIVRDHLLEYRGDAPGHETSIVFVGWGRQHKKDFVSIVEGVEPSKRKELCERLAFAVTDSGQETEFEASFKDHDSECLQIIRSWIAINRTYQQTYQNR